MQALPPEPPPVHRVARRWSGRALALGLCLVGGSGSPVAAQILNRTPPDQLQAGLNRPFEPRVPVQLQAPELTWLDRVGPHLPEWLAMTAEILSGGQLQPGKGWFRRGQALTRFPWPAVAARLDRNHDNSIARDEFPGPDADFRRLDRDGSQALTKSDFDFPRNALAKSRSRMIMSFADRNHDGKVKGGEYSQTIFLATRDQITRHAHFADAIPDIEKAYEASVKEGLPFLSAADFRATVDQAAQARDHMVIPNPDSDFEVAPPATLLRALVRREIGAPGAGPSLDAQAPDFTLPTDDGRGRVTLTRLLGQRPVVLIFASYTCPGFRGEAGTIEKLYQRYRNRAHFLVVAVREEHPSNGWVSRENDRIGLAIPQPTDDPGRASVARECRKRLGLTLPMVVDSVDDRVGILYSGMPDRLYLLDARGTVAAKSGRGPFGFNPDELEQALLLLLQAEAAAPIGSPAGGPAPTVRPAGTPTPPGAR